MQPDNIIVLFWRFNIMKIIQTYWQGLIRYNTMYLKFSGDNLLVETSQFSDSMQEINTGVWQSEWSVATKRHSLGGYVTGMASDTVEFSSIPIPRRIWRGDDRHMAMLSGIRRNLCTGWPTKVSHYQTSSLNRIKNRLCGYISHQFWV